MRHIFNKENPRNKTYARIKNASSDPWSQFVGGKSATLYITMVSKRDDLHYE